jgi:hypothetical protein
MAVSIIFSGKFILFCNAQLRASFCFYLREIEKGSYNVFNGSDNAIETSSVWYRFIRLHYALTDYTDPFRTVISSPFVSNSLCMLSLPRVTLSLQWEGYMHLGGWLPATVFCWGSFVSADMTQGAYVLSFEAWRKLKISFRQITLMCYHSYEHVYSFFLFWKTREYHFYTVPHPRRLLSSREYLHFYVSRFIESEWKWAIDIFRPSATIKPFRLESSDTETL